MRNDRRSVPGGRRLLLGRLRFRRTLRLEPLEARHLLTGGLHVLDLIPYPNGFVAEFNQRADWATADGTATTDGKDYTAVSVESGQLFAAGSTVAFTVNVQTTDDDNVELDETLSLILSNLSAGGRDVTFVGGEDTLRGTGTILNDDPVTIVGAPASVLERTPIELTTNASDAGMRRFRMLGALPRTGRRMPRAARRRSVSRPTTALRRTLSRCR